MADQQTPLGDRLERIIPRIDVVIENHMNGHITRQEMLVSIARDIEAELRQPRVPVHCFGDGQKAVLN